MVLEQYWTVLKKWWWLMVVSTLVAAGASYYSVSRQPRIYQAATTVMIGQGLLKANPTYQDFDISSRLSQTYVDMVQRRPILEGAAEALGLSQAPWSGNVSARVVPGTQLLEITVRDTMPERASALADEIARQLIQQSPAGSTEDQSRTDFVQTQLQRLEENIQATQKEIQEERDRLDAATSARAIQQFQSNINALESKLTSYGAAYASLAQTVEGGTNTLSIFEYATTPTRPIAPQVQQTVLLGAVTGLALALGGAILIEFLDDTLKTPDDVTRTLGLPTLGAIVHEAGAGHGGDLITIRQSDSPTAEAFRALRTNILFSSIDKPMRTLLVTSSNPVENKSIFAANLAVVMAQSGRTVALVDADMRRPTLHALFHLDNSLGLSSAVLDPKLDLPQYGRQLSRDRLAQLFLKGDKENSVESSQPAWEGRLCVIPSGPIPPNPADLLGSGRMETQIERLKEYFEVVILNTPPVLVATDAVVLSRRVDGVLLVSDARLTRRSVVRRAVERLRQVDAPLLGVVLNRAETRGSYDSYQSYYGHGEQERDAERLSLLKRIWSSVNPASPGRPTWPVTGQQAVTAPPLPTQNWARPENRRRL